MTDLYPFRDDYISTSEISRRLGFSLTAAFIQNTLGVKPSFRAGQVGGCYWSPEGAARVYVALMQHVAGTLGRHQVTDDHSSSAGAAEGQTETAVAVGPSLSVMPEVQK